MAHIATQSNNMFKILLITSSLLFSCFSVVILLIFMTRETGQNFVNFVISTGVSTYIWPIVKVTDMAAEAFPPPDGSTSVLRSLISGSRWLHIRLSHLLFALEQQIRVVCFNKYQQTSPADKMCSTLCICKASRWYWCFFPHNKQADLAWWLQKPQDLREMTLWALKLQLRSFRLDSSQLSAKLLHNMNKLCLVGARCTDHLLKNTAEENASIS